LISIQLQKSCRANETKIKSNKIIDLLAKKYPEISSDKHTNE